MRVTDIIYPHIQTVTSDTVERWQNVCDRFLLLHAADGGHVDALFDGCSTLAASFMGIFSIIIIILLFW